MNQLCQVEAFGIPTSKSVKLLNASASRSVAESKDENIYVKNENQTKQKNQKKLKTTGDNASTTTWTETFVP